MKSTLWFYLFLFFSFQLFAQPVNNNVETKLNINGVFPSLSLMGSNSGRSELGIGNPEIGHTMKFLETFKSKNQAR